MEFEVKTHLKFGLVGATTAAIYFLVLAFHLEIIRANYNIAVSIAYAVSVIFQFLANKYFTFESKTKNIAHQFSKFLVLLIVNYLLTILVVRYIVETVGYSPYIGVIASIPLIVVTGFLLSKYWIYTGAGKITPPLMGGDKGEGGNVSISPEEKP